ncbi:MULTISPECIES: sigma-70 RNA polymerase sigma factor region 4 domain-containing protein [unclassified Wolbachia]|uniref:sigma-70 family RNA polymerase sigma factor n=1 Tax=unclassified Wolbachia TaxID=2640676 RepID=UPI002220BF97|nr:MULTISPECIES: sigma-70 family RNA polymerase sigma factor [unclassified Wolbachia]
MKSKNSFSGVDPIIVKYIKYYASCLNHTNCFIDRSLEDIELELFCEVWPCLSLYDKTRSSFNTFVANLTRRRARNLLRNQLCTKRQINFGIDDNIPDSKYLEDDIMVYIDVKNIISKLPKSHRKLCELLKVSTITEAAKITGIPKTTVYNILRQIRDKFSSLK